MRNVNSEVSMEVDIHAKITNFVGGRVKRHPFLRNFEPAVRNEGRALQNVTERLLLDIFDPFSQVSYVLIGGIPGSGKTTLADAIAETITDASLDMVSVQRRSFAHYREMARRYMEKKGEEWTKARETDLATGFMKQEALHVMTEGPRLPSGKRRVVVAEMPIYPVDENERGLKVVRAIGKAERNRPYEERRARVLFVQPDLQVIMNGVVTRLMKMSSGGSPEMLLQIAEKAYAGALLFRARQPELYAALTRLIKDRHLLSIFRRNSPEVLASKIIAVRMLAILKEAGLYGTILMNPARRTLRRLSRVTPQRQSND